MAVRGGSRDAQRARGLLRALPPIALGHGLAVAAVLVAAAAARGVFPVAAVKVIVAGKLIAFGIFASGGIGVGLRRK